MFGLPGGEGGEGVGPEELLDGDAAQIKRQSELAADELIREADSGGVGGARAVVIAGDPGPVDCGQAHGAGFAAGVKLAVAQVKCAKLLTSLADGDDLRVGRRIIRRCNAVVAVADDLAVFDDDRAEGATVAGGDAIDREANGLVHEGGLG